MERTVWQTTVHGVAKSQPRLSDFHFSGNLNLFYQIFFPTVFLHFIEIEFILVGCKARQVGLCFLNPKYDYSTELG